MSKVIFYDHEKQGLCGDFIPFYWDDVYHLFTIIDGHWEHLTTKDFVDIENHGIAIPCGTNEEQDRLICTGSIFEWDGTFHCFYAGYNPEFTGKKPFQVVVHATSKDLYTWTKEKDIFMPPDESMYHRDGWRDPFVYYDEEKKLFKMIITGEENHSHWRRWGAVALAISKDLINWTVEKPLYAPYLFDTHECPDYFKMDGKWYLVFSTYTRWWENHYRIADHIDGPFYTPKDELLDNRSYYAAKTVSNGDRRFLVGWIAIREENSDKNKYQWGGSLGVHELKTNSNHELECHPVKEIVEAFDEIVEINPQYVFGNGSLKNENDGLVIDADGFVTIKLVNLNSTDFYFSCDVELKDNVVGGVLMRSDIDRFDKWCSVEVNRKKDVLFFDHVGKWFDDQYFDEQRPLKPAEKYHLEIISKGSIIVSYCNGKALSCRCYGYNEGEIGLFARDGKVKFLNILIKKGNF